MELPKKLLKKKLSAEELIELLENIEKQKARAIKDQQYQYAAELRDKERKYRAQLEDLMNPRLKEAKAIHIIGLGSAGSNILEQLYKDQPTFKYTMVTDPIRSSIPESVEFIHYNHHFPFRNELVEEDNILPEELIERIRIDEHLVLLTGLGGATGTLLTDQLIQFCINSNISFQVGCTCPLSFEGAKRLKLAEKFKLKYNDFQNVTIVKDETNTLFRTPEKKKTLLGDLFADRNAEVIKSMISAYPK
jgi:cell division GTPase FtsZ